MSLPNNTLKSQPLYNSVQGEDFNLQILRLINNDKYLDKNIIDLQNQLETALSHISSYEHITDSNVDDTNRNKKQIENVKGLVNDFINQFNALKDDIILNKDRIDNFLTNYTPSNSSAVVNDNINSLVSVVSGLRPTVDTNTSNITSIQTNIKNIQNTIDNISANINAGNTSNVDSTKIQADIQSINTTLDDMRATISNNTALLDANKILFDNFKTNIDNNSNDISKLQANDITFESNLQAIKKLVDNNATTSDVFATKQELQDTRNGIESDIAYNVENTNATISNIRDQMTSDKNQIYDDIHKAYNDINVNKLAITDLSNNVSGVVTYTQGFSTYITTNNTNVSGLTLQVETNKSDIGNLSTTVTDLSNTVSSLPSGTEFTNLSTTVTDLSNTVSTLPSGNEFTNLSTTVSDLSNTVSTLPSGTEFTNLSTTVTDLSNTVSTLNNTSAIKSWVDETANRAFDTVYSNTSGYPITVSLSYQNNDNANSSNDVYFYVDGVSVKHIKGYGGLFSYIIECDVPADSSYKITSSDGTIENWVELK